MFSAKDAFASAEGHPSSVMYMSFANQVFSAGDMRMNSKKLKREV